MIQTRLPRWPDRDKIPPLSSECVTIPAETRPVEFPSDMKIATPDHIQAVFSLAKMAHAESGYGEMDYSAIMHAVVCGCTGHQAVFGLIEGPDRLEAAIGLRLEKRWYAKNVPENWHNQDILFFVHPDHRKSRHAATLFRFAQWWERQSKTPVVLGLTLASDGARKELMYSRIGRKIGSLFLIDTHGRFPAKDALT